MIGDAARRSADMALQRLEHILAERPREVHADLATAVRGIVALRDDLIRAQRAGDTSPALHARLEQVNMLVSIGVGAEFPVTGLHWDRIAKTRDGLRELLERL